MFLNRRVIICVAVSFCILFLLSGCNEDRDYKVLSYFFDGVPLPESERLALEEQARLSDPNDAVAGLQDQPQEILYTHEPFKNCDLQCHGVREGTYFSGSVKLIVEPPQLCFDCHENMDHSVTKPGISVHGPVAAGECLMCHNPHKSKYKHILSKPVPEVCFQCHNAVQIELIEGHSRGQNCLKCHYGHSSEEKFLLRQGRSQESN